MEVKINQLKKYFGATKAVDGVSFSFTSGQIFGFVGPNGSGKTTTMRILATLDEPSDGDCFIDGISVLQEPEKARHLIGYMPDLLPTHRDISVHDYLDFFARAYAMRDAERRRTVQSIEEFTNLVGIRDKTLKALSKGMKQRVSLARALIHDPPLLIMDEPAAGLDPRARIELRELLKILAGRGKAILISSHILTELSEMCDGAVIIERGRMLRAGMLHDILMQNDKGQSSQRTVIIRPLGEVGRLHTAVLQIPGVESATINMNVVEVDLAGGDEQCGELLHALISQGFRIAEFRQQRDNLEKIFMDVTKGEVQ